MDTAVLLMPAPIRPRDLLAETRRLEAVWVDAVRLSRRHPSAENLAIQEAAHAAYQAEQRRAFAALGCTLPA